MRVLALGLFLAAALVGSAVAQSTERRWTYCYATTSENALVSGVFEYRGEGSVAPLNAIQGAFRREAEPRIGALIDAMCGAHATEDAAEDAQRNVVNMLEARGRNVREIWWTY